MMPTKPRGSKFNAELRVMVPVRLRNEIEAEADASAKTISAVVRDAIVEVLRRRSDWSDER